MRVRESTVSLEKRKGLLLSLRTRHVDENASTHIRTRTRSDCGSRARGSVRGSSSIVGQRRLMPLLRRRWTAMATTVVMVMVLFRLLRLRL